MQKPDQSTPQKPASDPATPSLADSENNSKQDTNRLPLRHIITSVLAAAVGVQSTKNQQKDFTNKQSIYIYIGAGLIFTTMFVLTVMYVVKIVLANAGA